jgi:hypothetical protein
MDEIVVGKPSPDVWLEDVQLQNLVLCSLIIALLFSLLVSYLLNKFIIKNKSHKTFFILISSLPFIVVFVYPIYNLLTYLIKIYQ